MVVRMIPLLMLPILITVHWVGRRLLSVKVSNWSAAGLCLAMAGYVFWYDHLFRQCRAMFLQEPTAFFKAAAAALLPLALGLLLYVDHVARHGRLSFARPAAAALFAFMLTLHLNQNGLQFLTPDVLPSIVMDYFIPALTQISGIAMAAVIHHVLGGASLRHHDSVVVFFYIAMFVFARLWGGSDHFSLAAVTAFSWASNVISLFFFRFIRIAENRGMWEFISASLSGLAYFSIIETYAYYLLLTGATAVLSLMTCSLWLLWLSLFLRRSRLTETCQ